MLENARETTVRHITL